MVSNQVLLGMVTQVGPRMPNKDNCMILHGTPPSRNRLSRSSLSRASTAAVQDSSLNSSSCTGHPALRCSKCVAHPDVMPLVARFFFCVMAHMAMGQNWVPKNRMVSAEKSTKIVVVLRVCGGFEMLTTRISESPIHQSENSGHSVAILFN